MADGPLQLPQITQQLTLDAKSYKLALTEATDYLKAFQGSVGQLQGTLGSKNLFEDLARGVGAYADALNRASKVGLEHAAMWERSSLVIQKAMGDATVRAGMVNRARTFSLVQGKEAGPMEVLRFARESIKAQEKAQQEVDAYAQLRAAKYRYGVGRTDAGLMGITPGYGGGYTSQAFGPLGRLTDPRAGLPYTPRMRNLYRTPAEETLADLFARGAATAGAAKVQDVARRMAASSRHGEGWGVMAASMGAAGRVQAEAFAQQQDNAFAKARMFVYRRVKELQENAKFGPYGGSLSGRTARVGEGTRGATPDELRGVFGAGFTPYQKTLFARARDWWQGAGGLENLGPGALAGYRGGLRGLVTGAMGGGVVGGAIVVGAGLYAAKKALDGLLDVSMRLGSMGLDAIEKMAHGLEFLAQKGMEVERLETTFGVLLRSVQAGKDEFKTLQRISVVTPYSVEQLSGASQILLGMGVEAKDLNGLLLRMGDIAAGDAGRLQRLAVVFGEVMAEGKITGWRIRQLASLGIGVEDIAKTMGVTGPTLRGLMRADLIPADALARTLVRLTSEGERFFRMNESQLEKTYGQWHRFENTVGVVLANVGKKFLEGAGIDVGLARMSNLLNDMSDTFDKLGAYAGKAFYKITTEFANLKYAFAAGLGGKDAAASFMTFLPSEDDLGRWTHRAGQLFIEMARVISKAVMTVVGVLEELVDEVKRYYGYVAKTAEVLSYLDPPWVTRLKKSFAGPGSGLLNAIPSPLIRGGIERAAEHNAGVDKFFDRLRTGFDNAPAAGRDAYRGAPPARTPYYTNPFTLSKAAQSIMDDIAKEEFGGKASGVHGVTGALKDFQREMAAISEIETKYKLASATREAGTWATAYGVALAQAGYSAFAPSVTGNPYAHLAVPPQISGAASAFLKMLPVGVGTPQEALDEKRFEGFMKLRQAVGGTISDHLPAAAEYGSAAAVDTINKTNSDNRSVLEEMLSVAQSALASNHQQEQLQREFVEALKLLPPELAKLFEGGF